MYKRTEISTKCHEDVYRLVPMNDVLQEVVSNSNGVSKRNRHRNRHKRRPRLRHRLEDRRLDLASRAALRHIHSTLHSAQHRACHCRPRRPLGASSGGHSYDVVPLDLSSVANVRWPAVDINSTSDERNAIKPVRKAYTPQRYKVIFQQPIDPERLARGRWSSAAEHPGDPDAGYRRYGASKLSEVMNLMASNLGLRGNLFMKAISKIMIPVANPVMTYFQPNGTLRTTS
ncbi:hypothetical protein DL767_010553 [Monosporascus sp. MG133]|nr:hypothetical protein DL767_010553 [Monosporascus sp. MG133]